MRRLKVWFPEFYTEAHFRRARGALGLVEALAHEGIDCQLNLTKDCDFIFCGSFFKYNETEAARRAYKLIPVVHYVWDMYPFQFVQTNGEGKLTVTASQWNEYREVVKSARELWVPSHATIDRVKMLTGLTAHVIKTSTEFYDEPIWDGGYVLDPVRNYPDPNAGMVKRACDELGIECVSDVNHMPRAMFKRLVAGCRLIVSAQYEASTGSLALLEAYYLGKQVLCSNSPRNGAKEYLGPTRAQYFQWDGFDYFKTLINVMYNRHVDAEKDHKSWAVKTYSDARMAHDMAKRFRELADGP